MPAAAAAPDATIMAGVADVLPECDVPLGWLPPLAAVVDGLGLGAALRGGRDGPADGREAGPLELGPAAAAPV